MSSLRVIDSVESSICEEERRSNPDEELYYLDCFVPRSDAMRNWRYYFTMVNFFVVTSLSH